MSTRIATLAAAALVVLAAQAPAQTLRIGDPAPALQATLVKGDALPSVLTGKVRVVEFWATWCGPCRQSIPHLSELQKQYPAVQFIGVSVWERDQSKVEPFVTQMGDKMAYTVARDLIPEGKGGDAGAMANAWMTAAEQDGIPAAFIVGADGKIAWIGHPMEMEKTLEQVVAGKWDVKAYAARAAKMKEVDAKFEKAIEAKDFKAALAAIDEKLALDPDGEASGLGITKFRIMLETKAFDQAYAYAARLVDVTFKDQAQMLNSIAWFIVDPDAKLEKRDFEVALRSAKRANELTEDKDPSVLDTLAAVYFGKGDLKKAIEVQSRAVELSAGMQGEDDLKARLEQYKKAAQSQKS